MLPDDPRHGSYAGAQRHWKDGETACAACLTASRRSNKRRELAIMAGNPARVPLGEDAYRIVVTASRAYLAAATGIRKPRLRDFELAGPAKVVHRDTRARILAAGRPWTAIGIQRRLQALACVGWSGRVISERTGVYGSALCNLRRRTGLKFVRAHVAQAVLDLYAELADQAPPDGRSATETRNHAERMGWAAPGAWNDIDDPDETPDPGWSPATRRDDHDLDPVVVDRVLAGDFDLAATRAERLEVVARWRNAGHSLNELERNTGWNVARLTRKPSHDEAA